MAPSIEPLENVKALTFDVSGTVKARDIITSRAFSGLSESLQSCAFAQEWRNCYSRLAQTYPGSRNGRTSTRHHYDDLKELLQKHTLAGSRLTLPGTDSALGTRRLGTRYVTATLSNGTGSCWLTLKPAGDRGFKRIISAANLEAYKPHPSTYLVHLIPSNASRIEVAMVAAHLGDLYTARVNGLRMIYIGVS
ncbi:HAD-like domain-containing protein [Nemania serpens]|nr:HAD-like domain-containing protein [Nemania serpens]